MSKERHQRKVVGPDRGLIVAPRLLNDKYHQYRDLIDLLEAGKVPIGPRPASDLPSRLLAMARKERA